MIKKAIPAFIFLFLASLCEAAIWENIPALPQAQKVKQEEASVNSKQVQTTIYITLSTPQEAVEFYKTRLINFGWKLESKLSIQGIEILIYSKEGKFLNIKSQNILGKNYITVAQSVNPKESVAQAFSCPECENKQDSAGKDLRFVPRYPGAIRVNSIERDNGKKALLTYSTKDSVDKVLNFYSQNMGNYYWKLENTVDFQNLPQGVSDKLEMSIQGETLVFKSPSASCIISVTKEPQNKTTVIGVTYNE